jgi:hypothetical protein
MNSRGAALYLGSPTDMIQTARNVQPIIQAVVRIRKIKGIIMIVGVPLMKELVTFIIATAN